MNSHHLQTTKKSREELEAMLGLSELKQTKVYQEAKAEGQEIGEQKAKLESVPRLLKLGLTEKQIAQALQLTVKEVRQIAKSQD